MFWYLTQVTFTCGTKAILNRQNFEWNKSLFSEEFKNSSNASEFISVWQRTTKLDARKQQAIPISEAMLSNSPESSQTSSSGHSSIIQHGSHIDAESPNVQPAPKRICTHSERSSGNSSFDQMQVHSNPIDDTILSKRIGM